MPYGARCRAPELSKAGSAAPLRGARRQRRRSASEGPRGARRAHSRWDADQDHSSVTQTGTADSRLLRLRSSRPQPSRVTSFRVASSDAVTARRRQTCGPDAASPSAPYRAPGQWPGMSTDATRPREVTTLGPEPLRPLRSEDKGQAGACPDRTRAIPYTVRAVSAIRNMRGMTLAARRMSDRVRAGRSHKFARSQTRPPEP